MRARRLEDAGQLGLGFSPAEMTRVPATDWRPPSDLPDKLHGSIAVDLETKDDGISAGRGAGWAWGGGRVVGYSVCSDDFCGYLPIAHEGGGNMDPALVRRWLTHVLGDVSQTKVFANAMYDLGWAEADGVEIRGPVVDVLMLEALLDENKFRYDLDATGRDRVGRGKNEEELRRAAEAYGYHPKKELWRLPAQHVGVYAEDDARLPLDVLAAQRPLVEEQGLQAVAELEHDLLPMYMDMRRRGVRIDQSRAEHLRDAAQERVGKAVAEIKRRTGVEVNVWAAESIARAFDDQGLRYGRTAKTSAPSITKNLLERTDHWLARLILEAREADKLRSTFYEGQILNQLHRGRVHGEIHPLKSDEGGTTTGRLSMSKPNLQFIPARTEEGRLVRTCFLPEEGEEWCSNDFSQQEPRLLVHFASLVKRGGAHLPGAVEARDRYRTDPSMSYHDFAAELTGLPYKSAKILNLAIIYGRGKKETAAELGQSVDEVSEMFDRHAEEMPFVRALSRTCQDQVRRKGYVRSLLGRRARFDLWEPDRWDDRDGQMLPREEAEALWPGKRLTRARIHKALNSLIQPSAADQTKAAMRAVWREGLGRHVLVQVHDELGSSVPDRETGGRVAEIMQDAVKLEVPSKVDPAFGPSWGEAR